MRTTLPGGAEATALTAGARIVAIAAASGRTALPVLCSAVPLVLRRTGGPGGPGGPDGAAWVHLVGGAAGPLGGDRLRLEIEVGAGAVLRLRSAAAAVALPGRNGGASTLDILATVAAGGLLDVAPEPLVAAAGARHTTRVRVDLAEGAGLRWRDELVCGRYGEEPGQARTELSVRHAGRPLLAHALAIGPGAPGWDSPAVLGPARAAATVFYAGTEAAHAPAPGAATDIAVAALAGPGVLVTAVGRDALALGRLLTAVEHGEWPSLGNRE